MKIRITNQQRKIHINKRAVIALAKKILKIKRLGKAELSILFVGKNRIRKLNKKFRNIDKPTDVLAFSMGEGRDADIHPEILGDIVICPRLAEKAAKIYKSTTFEEINLYLIHGILHLLGYDDSTSKSRSLMKKEEVRILRKIKRK